MSLREQVEFISRFKRRKSRPLTIRGEIYCLHREMDSVHKDIMAIIERQSMFERNYPIKDLDKMPLELEFKRVKKKHRRKISANDFYLKKGE